MKFYELLTVLDDNAPILLDCTRSEECMECPGAKAIEELTIPEASEILQMDVFNVGLRQNNMTGDMFINITLVGDITQFLLAMVNIEDDDITVIIFD